MTAVGVGVDDDPQRLGGAVEAADGEVRVVGAGGAGADDHGVGLGAQPVDVGAGLAAEVIQRLVPSAAAMRPSRVAAYFHST